MLRRDLLTVAQSAPDEYPDTGSESQKQSAGEKPRLPISNPGYASVSLPIRGEARWEGLHSTAVGIAPQALQIDAQLCHRQVALVPVFLQGFIDDLLQFRRNLGVDRSGRNR